jgi:ATP-dependent Zn protease
MVARFGMSDEIGLARLFGPDSSAFLGDETPLADISAETKASLDTAIRRLIAEAQTEATVLLEHHRQILDSFAATLAEAETLEGVALQSHLDDLRGRMQPVGKASVRARGVKSAGVKSTGVNGAARPRRATTAGR